MIHQRDQWWWFKLNGATRKAIVDGRMNLIAHPVVLTEYPKSGGTWLSQMLAEALQIPYPRNRLPMLQRQIIHGCYRQVHPKVDTILCWRDGRDTMISFYYHLIFDKPITSKKFSQQVNKQLNITDRYDIKSNLPRFIEWAFEGGYPGFSWVEFYNTWKAKSGYVETSYEKVTEDPLRELKRVLAHITDEEQPEQRLEGIVERYSFEAQSNRKRGEEDVKSFVRKGIVGDWKNHFGKEACEIFDHYAGDVLIALGYEQDRDWIERQSKGRN